MKNSLRLRHFCASGKKEKEKEKKPKTNQEQWLSSSS
jgi:hypothetical protein